MSCHWAQDGGRPAERNFEGVGAGFCRYDLELEVLVVCTKFVWREIC